MCPWQCTTTAVYATTKSKYACLNTHQAINSLRQASLIRDPLDEAARGILPKPQLAPLWTDKRLLQAVRDATGWNDAILRQAYAFIVPNIGVQQRYLPDSAVYKISTAQQQYVVFMRLDEDCTWFVEGALVTRVEGSIVDQLRHYQSELCTKIEAAGGQNIKRQSEDKGTIYMIGQRFCRNVSNFIGS